MQQHCTAALQVEDRQQKEKCWNSKEFCLHKKGLATCSSMDSNLSLKKRGQDKSHFRAANFLHNRIRKKKHCGMQLSLLNPFLAPPFMSVYHKKKNGARAFASWTHTIFILRNLYKGITHHLVPYNYVKIFFSDSFFQHCVSLFETKTGYPFCHNFPHISKTNDTHPVLEKDSSQLFGTFLLTLDDWNFPQFEMFPTDLLGLLCRSSNIGSMKLYSLAGYNIIIHSFFLTLLNVFSVIFLRFLKHGQQTHSHSHKRSSFFFLKEEEEGSGIELKGIGIDPFHIIDDKHKRWCWAF